MSFQEKINSAKRAFANTKTRIIIIILLIIIVVVFGIAYIRFKRIQSTQEKIDSSIAGAPPITSIPGLGQPTREYAKLQEQQNLELAEEAARKGTAAIPTVVRTTYLDTGVSSDFAPVGCGVEDLKRASKSGVSAAQLRCRGCSLAALREAGFSVMELRSAGFSAQELKDAGFIVQELKDAGFNASELRSAGFSAGDLVAAMFTDGELKVSDISAKDLVSTAISAADIKNKVKELKNAGFSAKELVAASVSAKDLVAAGFSDGELKATGFSDKDLVAAKGDDEVTVCSVNNLKLLLKAGIGAAELKNLGCSEQALKLIEFTDKIGKSDLVVSSDINPTPEKIFVVKALESQKDLGRLTEAQMQNMTTEELEGFMSQQQAMMKQQASDLFSAWTPIPSQQYVEGEVPPTPSSKDLTKASLENAVKIPEDIYKAGSVIFATLDSEVNSDENTPVMATIITGPLKGSKVLGNFQRVDKKVLLQFSVISVPKLKNSIAINAVGVDPNTSGTALATSVNNHYLERYGALIATSFISGFGEAMQSSGSNTQITSMGTTTTYPKLDYKQQALVGLSKVGEKVGTVIESKIDKPPTVKVHVGTGIGLLLIADLAVPKF